MNIKKEYEKYASELQKEAFDLKVFKCFADAVNAESGNEYEKEILAKILNDYTEHLPYLYKKYQDDIRFACENGCEIPYEQLAGENPESMYHYEVFDTYFKDLKKLVKDYEHDMNVVMDLISAKDRIEAVRVIMLETEANLNKITK